jgi:hypothetical protein
MNLTPDYIAWTGIGAVASAVVSIVATVATFPLDDLGSRYGQH